MCRVLSRSTSVRTLASSTAGSQRLSPTVQPKLAASCSWWRTAEPYTSSFLGTQPRITQVPPTRSPSMIATLAP